MRAMRRNPLWPIALGLAAILLFCWFFFSSMRRPLSPLEAQLVGEWTSNSGGETRIFYPDHSYSSHGQFEGKWFIDGNRLTIEYWLPSRIRDVYSVDDFLLQLRRSWKTSTNTIEIEFGDDDQTLSFFFLSDHERRPGGKWKRCVGPTNSQ